MENKYIKADSSLFTLRVVIMPVQEKHNMKGEENLIGSTMDFFWTYHNNYTRWWVMKNPAHYC